MPVPQEVLDQAVKADSLKSAEGIMAQAGIITCGVECVSCGGVELHYVNLGDTYDQTICREDDGPLFIGSWGAWYEATEAQQNEDDGTITCAWCSHRTPMDKDDWREVVCESCGNCVNGDKAPEKPKTVRYDADKVTIWFQCPICSADGHMPASSLVTNGTAVCPDCDCDMDVDYVEVET